MDCREARHRLMTSRPESADEDTALQEHLSECDSCAREAHAYGLLNRLYQTAAEDSGKPEMPMADQRRIVQARAARLSRSQSRKSRKVASGRAGLSHRPVYAAGLVTVAAMLVLFLLVPFGYYRTIGYDLAVEGVNKDLALDDERMCDLFMAVGLVEATIDVVGCDTTCNLLVYDLKSTEEVRLVVSMLDNLSARNLTTNVTPVVARASGSLIQRANEGIIGTPSGPVRHEDIL